jgi:hypothetical protein
MKLDDCLRIINRHLREAQQEVVRRQRQGLQSRPWQHRIVELEAIRREIAALSTPEALRARLEPAGPLHPTLQ